MFLIATTRINFDVYSCLVLIMIMKAGMCEKATYREEENCHLPLRINDYESKIWMYSSDGETFKCALNGDTGCTSYFNGSAHETDDNWIQIDLNMQKVIAGIQTQGLRGNWVSTFTLYHSFDCETFQPVLDVHGKLAILEGNFDDETIVTNMLADVIVGRCVRLVPESVGGKANMTALRWDLLGCDPKVCQEAIVQHLADEIDYYSLQRALNLEDESYYTSSKIAYVSNQSDTGFKPQEDIVKKRKFLAKVKNPMKLVTQPTKSTRGFAEFKFLSEHFVFGIVLYSSKNKDTTVNSPQQKVNRHERFIVTFSRNCHKWEPVRQNQGVGDPKVFQRKAKQNSQTSWYMFPYSVKAQCIRIIPITYQFLSKKAKLRAHFIGCGTGEGIAYQCGTRKQRVRQMQQDTEEITSSTTEQSMSNNEGSPSNSKRSVNNESSTSSYEQSASKYEKNTYEENVSYNEESVLNYVLSVSTNNTNTSNNRESASNYEQNTSNKSTNVSNYERSTSNEESAPYNENSTSMQETNISRNKSASNNEPSTSNDTITEPVYNVFLEYRYAEKDNVTSTINESTIIHHRQKRVIGGKPSERGLWPWLVSIKLYNPNDKKYSHVCGGSLIHPEFVLTAAHCINVMYSVLGLGVNKTVNTSSWNDPFFLGHIEISIGDHSLSIDDDLQLSRDVKQIITHTGYNASYYINDLSLLKLRQPVRLTDHVNLVCLPPAKLWENWFPPGTNCHVIGWGRTSSGYPVIPHDVRLPLISTEDCRKMYSHLTLTDDMFCAGVPDGSKDACIGDSGGPLLCENSDFQWYQVGIVSWNIGCAMAGYPGVYSKVALFTGWIDNAINEHL